MHFLHSPFLALALALTTLTTLTHATENCRKYDVVFVYCQTAAQLKPIATGLAGLVGEGWEIAEQGLSAGTTSRCLGGEGTYYIYENKKMLKTDGPPIDCEGNDKIKYETKVRINRWRKNWDYCADINFHMNKLADQHEGLTFWYNNPRGNSVRCLDVAF